MWRRVGGDELGVEENRGTRTRRRNTDQPQLPTLNNVTQHTQLLEHPHYTHQCHILLITKGCMTLALWAEGVAISEENSQQRDHQKVV